MDRPIQDWKQEPPHVGQQDGTPLSITFLAGLDPWWNPFWLKDGRVFPLNVYGPLFNVLALLTWIKVKVATYEQRWPIGTRVKRT
jgi:hypothetical protein